MSDPSRSVTAKRYLPAAFGIGGVVAGCTLTAVFAGRPAEHKVVAQTLRAERPQVLAPPAPVKTVPAPKPAAPADQPLDPLGGSFVVKNDQTQPPILKGVILPQPGDIPVAKPLQIPPPKASWNLSTMRPTSAPPVSKPAAPAVAEKKAPLLPVGPSGTLDTVRVSVANPDTAIADLTAFVTQANGCSQPFSEQLSDDRPIMKGLLILVPAKDAADLLDHAEKLGSLLDKRHWVGLLTDRALRIAKGESDRLDALQGVHDDLLKTYKPDDLPVKQIEDEIATAQQSVDQLKLNRPTDGMAVVKVLFAAGS